MYRWPDTPAESLPLDGRVLYVLVTTPHDQAELHRLLAAHEFVPTCLDEGATEDLWRFHHPDGARPL